MTASAREFNQFAVTVTFNKDEDLGETHHLLLEYAMRLGIYAALTAIFLMVIALIMKLLWNCDGDEAGGETEPVSESSRLLSSKDDVVINDYGTSGKDLESGSNSSSEDDLYDGTICVICYDDQRNCFFFPCGHCVACHSCASRILKDENKTCPICRSCIDKVRKLIIV